MKGSNYTEEQIAFALKRATLGSSIYGICHKMGISDATFYNWNKTYGGLGPSEQRCPRQFEEKNGKLKRVVADLSLDKVTLQEYLQKSYKTFLSSGAHEQSDAAFRIKPTPSVCGNRDFLLSIWLPISGEGHAATAFAHQGDRRGANALRLSARARTSAA